MGQNFGMGNSFTFCLYNIDFCWVTVQWNEEYFSLRDMEYGISNFNTLIRKFYLLLQHRQFLGILPKSACAHEPYESII